MSISIELHDFSKIETFSTIFQNMKFITDQINIVCSEERLYIQTMDTSKISILEISIPATWFHSYICTESVTIGVSSSLFHKIVSTRDKTQVIKMTYNNDTDRLFFEMSSENKKAFDRSFEIPLIDLECDTMTIPDMDYQAELSMPSSSFATLISQLKTFGETLDFVCNESKLELISKTGDQGQMMVSVGIEELSSFSIDEDAEINVSYSLNHLHVICAYSKICKEVEIRVSNDIPLRLDYKSEDLTIKYFLAPKMNEDV